jgi:hypothetical protein
MCAVALLINNTIQLSILQYNTIQYSTMQYNTLVSIAVVLVLAVGQRIARVLSLVQRRDYL